MAKMEVVYVVFKYMGLGSIAGVFSSMDKATAFVQKQYDPCSITEHVIDSEVSNG